MDVNPLEDCGQYKRLLPKLLSPTTNIVDGIRVIKVHSRRTTTHMTKKTLMNNKSENEA